MAATKGYAAEHIVAKLREAERLQGQGATIPQVCKKLQVSEQRGESPSRAASRVIMASTLGVMSA